VWQHRGILEVSMPLVRITTKYQVTIPNVLRRKMSVGAGDVFEAKLESGKITLTPKPDAEPEYTPEQRRIIDARLARGLADVRQGRTAGPFETADEMIASMKRELTKRPTRDSDRAFGGGGLRRSRQL
jgi:bifunctional DNA-binding transcriptional regulator/antitoxin component of YhaV-PrlF toxin-antitoxin module